MTAAEYAGAHDIGYAATASHLAGVFEEDPYRQLDRDDVREAVHPEAFSEALTALPQCEALDISIAVDAGISDAFEAAT